MRKLMTVAMAVLLGGALAACGGDDDNTAMRPTLRPPR